MALIVETFLCLADNYGFLVHDPETGATAAIDAPETAPILAKLDEKNWRLSDILVTHHHFDHTQAIPEIRQATGALVTGPEGEASQIGHVDRAVSPGDTVRIGSVQLSVIATPGHTLHHVVYHDPEGGHLFAGDALFSLGCGRMLEGTPEPMWEGLDRLRRLPDETLVYCGHEYTAANARFALSVDPENRSLKARASEVEHLRAEGRPTVPSRLGDEKLANPFLRADVAELARAVGRDPGSPPAEIFAAIRAAKDNF